MSDLQTPEFSRIVTLDALRQDEGASLALEADAEERAALARRFGAASVDALTATVRAEPWLSGGWRIHGVVKARLTQTCVVTLEPVETALEEPFSRYFIGVARMDEALEALGADAREDLEPLTPEINVGEIAAEAAALGVDPYPRKADADFGSHVHGPPDVEPLTDEAARPFAKLAALRRGDGQGSA